MDRLEAMSLLVSVVEEGSFSAASRKLGTPLPTVARKIAELEAHLKTRVLVRTTRKLSLTDAGAAYIEACKQILELVGDAETQVAGEYTAPKGELTITAPIVLGRLHVLPTVSAFLAEYPDINVRMTLADRTVNLVEEHIDMAIRMGKLSDSSLIAIKVGMVRRVVCGSPEYFRKHGVPKTPEDLGKLTCVTYSGLAAGPSWMFALPGGGLHQAAPPLCRLNINTAESAIDATIDGLGVTHVISYQVAKAIREGFLQVVLQEFEPEGLPVSLVYSNQGLMPLKMRTFLEFAAPRLRKSLRDDLAVARTERDKESIEPSQKTA
jgi:DNA-binding transcriptional LysR family regulator